MSPKQFKELLAELKAAVGAINSTMTVVDDSQLATRMQNKSTLDNIILVGVLPEYGHSGANVDSYKQNMTGQLLIVEKTDYSDLDDDQFIDLFERCYQAAEEVKKKLLALASTGCYPMLMMLDINSLDIYPVWKKAECNGYSIDLQTL